MNKKKIYLIVFFLITGFCLFSFIWGWIVTKEVRKTSKENLKQTQKINVANIILTETKDNTKYWELYAKDARYEGSLEKIALHNILGNFYNKNGEVVLSFSATEGTYSNKNKLIALRGDVYAVAKDGSSVYADNVYWKEKDDNIIAVGNVRINRNNELLTKSKKAVFNSQLTYFRIEGNSETKIYKNDNKTGKELK